MDNEGIDPPAATLIFPIALAVGPGDAGDPPRHLFVANANFDLRYNAGTVQSYDLFEVNRLLDACTDPPCEIDPPDVLISEVRTGSFASDLALGADAARLYVTIRSDSNLTFINVRADGRLQCGGDPGAFHACTSLFRSGDERLAEERGLELPPDPVALATGSLETFGRPSGSGNWIAIAHRGGGASFFVDAQASGEQAPLFVDVLRELGSGLSEIELDPRSLLFWLPSAQTRRIARAGVALDAQSPAVEDAFLYEGNTVTLSGVDFGSAARGGARAVAFDPRPGAQTVFALGVVPEAVMWVDREALQQNEPSVQRAVDVGFGPAKLDVAEIRGQSLLFASCFESRELYIIDADLARVVAVTHGFGGPFDLSLDSARERLYVADFRTSVIQVVDLAPLLDCLSGSPGQCAPQILGRIGHPRPVEELQ